MSTLYIVPQIENEQVIYMTLKTDLHSDNFALLVTESDQPGTVSIEAGNSFIQEEFLSGHYRQAMGRTVDNQIIFEADYYSNTIIPECATYLGCERIQLSN